MPPFGPIKRSELIYNLRKLGFSGPYAGGKHQFMMKGELRVRIPNPHHSDIGKNLLGKVLNEAEIDRNTWEIT